MSTGVGACFSIQRPSYSGSFRLLSGGEVSSSEASVRVGRSSGWFLRHYSSTWSSAGHSCQALLASVLGNYLIGRQLERSPSRWLLLLGVGANLSLIIWFKYAHFVLNTVNDVWGAGWTLPTIVLPLAISFYTFQQIAYLVHVHAGQPSEPDLTRYAFSVLFFPQLIAGPIVYNRHT